MKKLKVRRNNDDLLNCNWQDAVIVVMKMVDCAVLQYDWRLRPGRLKMTDFYWRRQSPCSRQRIGAP